MRKMRKNFKAMGLVLLAVCSFGAVSAAGARGAAPEFTVEGLAAGAKAPLAENITVTPTGGTLSLTVPNLLQIACTEGKFDEGFIVNKTGEGTIKSLTLFGCVLQGPKGETTSCEVRGGTPETKGQIHTLPLKIALSTGSSGQHYMTFVEDIGELLGELRITECALEGKYKLRGAIATQVLSPASGVLAATSELETSEAVQKASGKRIPFGGREMFPLGKLDIKLASGGKWGVDW
jgi:hypothetical protein